MRGMICKLLTVKNVKTLDSTKNRALNKHTRNDTVSNP